jgi:hypothetical protein
MMWAAGFRIRDPGSVPILSIHHGRGEFGGNAPGGLRAHGIPDASLPPDTLERAQRRAVKRNPGSLRGSDTAGVPDVALIARQILCGSSSQYLVGGLLLAAAGRCELPGKARARCVDTDGRGTGFSFEGVGCEPSRKGGGEAARVTRAKGKLSFAPT